jgi:ubiquitin-conjugating enzyme E2 O
VQSVNAHARTAHIRISSDAGKVELVPLLELDAYGTGAAVGGGQTPSNFDSLGVRRGDFVFVHAVGTTNGAEKGRVPRIGEVPAWVREVVMDDNGGIGGWRAEMNALGIRLAQERGGPPVRGEGEIRKTERGDTSFNWLGEVTDLKLDGSVEVTLADGTVEVFPLERLTKLYDGMDHLDDPWDEEGSQGSEFTDEEDVAMVEVIGGDDAWPGGDEGDWEDVEEEEDALSSSEGEAQDWAMNDEAEEPPSPPLKGSGDMTPQAPQRTSDTTPREAEKADDLTRDIPSSSQGEEEDLSWERFEILAEAPADHAFYATKPAQPSKNFMTRLTKEYRVLQSSLPGMHDILQGTSTRFLITHVCIDSVLVRAYEDRADLLRCMIIGSENTPYQDAPFVIDWMLNSDFPQTPPVAHFHSWTNGNGRVNPNLYEEGKVCLSILGTWSGDKNEIWSAARSSLLQAFVSIQGLVLVKEPWFCEPAYEKLRGTQEGIVNR